MLRDVPSDLGVNVVDDVPTVDTINETELGVGLFAVLLGSSVISIFDTLFAYPGKLGRLEYGLDVSRQYDAALALNGYSFSVGSTVSSSERHSVTNSKVHRTDFYATRRSIPRSARIHLLELPRIAEERGMCHSL